MSTITRFEDLKSWQKARELCQLFYFHFIENQTVKDFELNQINRSSGSVMDNIAEGFERNGNKELNQFLSIAKAFCGEVKSQLYRSLDRKYVSKIEFDGMFELAEEVSKLIGSFMSYLRKTDIKESKFKREETLNSKH